MGRSGGQILALYDLTLSKSLTGPIASAGGGFRVEDAVAAIIDGMMMEAVAFWRKVRRHGSGC